MVFWPNFRQIGGYVFFRNWPFVHTHFLPFSAIFDNFRPVFGYKSQKRTKLNHLGAMRMKKIGKIVPKS